MSVPPWMMPPDPPRVTGRDVWHPHVIRHEFPGDGTVLVTIALSGLRRATVRVPTSSWIDGEHFSSAAFLQSLDTLAQGMHFTPQHDDDGEHDD